MPHRISIWELAALACVLVMAIPGLPMGQGASPSGIPDTPTGALRAVGGPEPGGEATPPPPPSTPSVGATLDLLNNTLSTGNFIPVNGDGLTSAAFDPQTGDLYILSTNEPGVLVVNATTYQWTGGTRLGFSPEDILYDPEDQELYVSSVANNYVSLLNPRTLATVGQIILAQCPAQMLYSGVVHEVDVENQCSDTISVLNASTNVVGATWSLPSGPGDMAVDPAHNTLLIAAGGFVTVLNETNGAQVAHVGLGSSYIESMVVDPRVNRAFLDNELYGNTTVLNTTTDQTLGFSIPASAAGGLGVDPTQGRLFVSMYSSVLVYNTSTLAFMGFFPSGPFPSLCYVTPPDERLFLLYSQYANLSVDSTATGTVLAPSIGLGVSPWQLATAPRGGTLFVMNNDGQNISLVNLTTDRVTGWITSIQDPADPVLNPTTDEVYVTGTGPTENLFALNGSSGAIDSSHSLPGVGPLAYDPNNRDLYTLHDNYPFGFVTVTNTVTWSSVATIAVGASPVSLAYDPSNQEIYVAEETYGNVSVISTENQSVVATIHTNSPWLSAIAVDSMDGKVFVTNDVLGEVFVINVSMNAIVATLPVGISPDSVTYDPGDGQVFVANAASNTVSVINPANLSETSTFPVGLTPAALDYDVSENAVYVADSTSGSISIVNVGPGVPRITSFTATPSVTDVGRNITFRATVAFGSPPYSYSYSGLPSGCLSANASQISCVPDAPGSSTVQVSVTDQQGIIASSSVSVGVNADPFVVFLRASPADLTVNTSTGLRVLASGGTGNFSYLYSGLPPGCAASSVSQFTCTPDAAGSFLVGVIVRDTLGVPASSNVVLDVNIAPMVAGLAASPSTVEVGTQTQFLASVVGGTGPLSYTYLGLPTGCTSEDTPALHCTPTGAGGSMVRLVATDADGVQAVAFVELSVDSRLGLVSASITPGVISLGSTVNILFVVQSGVGPLRYVYSGLPPGCSSVDASQFFCLPNRTGSFVVTMSATDGEGVSVTGTQTLEVHPSPSTGNPFGASLTSGDITDALLAVAAVEAVTIAVLVLRHRRGKEPPPAPVIEPPPLVDPLPGWFLPSSPAESPAPRIRAGAPTRPVGSHPSGSKGKLK